jgi:hypothetical protein
MICVKEESIKPLKAQMTSSQVVREPIELTKEGTYI